MLDPVEEVRDICEKLTLEHQQTLLKYAQELYIAENAGEKAVNPDLSDMGKLSQESSAEGEY
jgi:hypothetical protein